jgi:hypothetical protein
MDSVLLSSPYDVMRFAIQYGFFFLSIADSILVVIASKLKITDNIAGFPMWLKLHYRYGIWKVNIIKLFISIILPYPELALSPRFGLLFFYFIHVLVFSYRLFSKALKYK